MKKAILLASLLICTITEAQNTELSKKLLKLKEKSGYTTIKLEENTFQLQEQGGDNSPSKKIQIPDEFLKHTLKYRYEDNMYFLKFENNKTTKNCELNVCQINIHSGQAKHYPKLSLGNYKEQNISSGALWGISVRPDGSIFLLSSSGRETNPSSGALTIYWVISVFSIDKDFSNVLWKHVVPEPVLTPSKAAADFKSFNSIGPNEFLISFEGGIQGNLNKQSNCTYYYKNTANGLVHLWSHSVPQVQAKTEQIKGAPFPFITQDGEFMYFDPIYKSADSETITLHLKDQNDKIVKSYPTKFSLPKLTAKYYVDFSTGVFFDDTNKEKARVLLIIEDGRKLKGKHPKYFLNLKIDRDEISEQYFINGENVPELRIPRRCLLVDNCFIFEALHLIIENGTASYEKIDDFELTIDSKGSSFLFGKKNK